MNVWVAIVIGLGSGLFGTLATISHEREAEFRRRMIEAADEFVGRAMSIVIAIRDSWLQLKLEDGTMTASAFEDETLDERMDRIFREIDALTLSLARVTLLFALERTVDAAGDVATAIAAARDRLWDARTEK